MIVSDTTEAGVPTTEARAPEMTDTHTSFIKRIAMFAYGVGSYAVGVAALMAWILSMLGLLPFTGGPLQFTGVSAVALNLALMFGFGLQHSIMARPAFKTKWAKLVSPAGERATFVLATGLVLGPLILMWQPMPTTIWNIQSSGLSTALLVASVGGWAYLFLATFAINHFELFGLRQVYQYLTHSPVTPVPFKERWMYRFDRHPIMTGALLGMWLTPHMQLDHLLFAAFASAYIMVGVHFEERSLRRQWGSTYTDYCKRVRSLVPTFRAV